MTGERIPRTLGISFSERTATPLPGVTNQLELNPEASIPRGIESLRDILDSANRSDLRRRAFRWVKALGGSTVNGRSLRSLFREEGVSFWWWCEAPIWEGWRDIRRFPGAVQVFWTIEGIREVLSRTQPNLVVVSGTAGNTLLRLAAEICKDFGVPVRARLRPAPGVGLPLPLKTQLFAVALRNRRRQQHARGLRRGTNLFVSYATRVRMSRDGEDSNIAALTAELERRNEPWHTVVVDNIADATAPWRPSINAFPKGYEPLEGLISRQPASRAALVSLRVGRRARGEWPRICEVLTLEGFSLRSVYDPAFSILLSTHVPAAAYYYAAFLEVLEAWQPERLIVVNETGYAGRSAVAAGRRLGIPTIGLQHGVIAPFHVEYVLERGPGVVDGPDACPIPTRTLLDGRFYREVLENESAYPPESLVVTGAPRYDTFLARLRAYSGKERRHLTVVTQPTQDMATFRSIVQVAASMPQVDVVIRPHPLEDPSRYVSALKEMDIKAAVLANEDLAGVFAESLAVVAPFSTAVVEANLAELPVAVVNFTGEKDYLPYAERGGAVRVTSTEELRAVVLDFLQHGPHWSKLEQSRPAFLEDFAAGAGNETASRMLDAILVVGGGKSAGRPSEDRRESG